MCCSVRCCVCLLCVVLVATVVAILFGFHVFTDGFHRIKDTLHDCVAADGAGCVHRPFLGAPPPYGH